VLNSQETENRKQSESNADEAKSDNRVTVKTIDLKLSQRVMAAK
jgi:hypothetical protein